MDGAFDVSLLASEKMEYSLSRSLRWKDVSAWNDGASPRHCKQVASTMTSTNHNILQVLSENRCEK
jgi:hypothetical protein